MFKALRRYLNAALIGFIITFVVYLFVRFDPDKIVLGIVISLVGAAVGLIGDIFLDRQLGRRVIHKDRKRNPVRR
jgi:FtsH-binding integral membrane protein